jgi:hypothetical protein
MGAWGVAPWDNDTAADWFGEVFDELPLARKVEEALELDGEEDHEQIRAAAAVLIMLGRTYIWPVEDLERHLKLAIARLKEIRPLYEATGGEEWAEAIDGEIAVLEARLANEPDGQFPSEPPGWEEFWGP